MKRLLHFIAACLLAACQIQSTPVATPSSLLGPPPASSSPEQTTPAPTVSATGIPTRTDVPTIEASLTPSPVESIQSERGYLGNLVSHVEKRMPRANSQGYVSPTIEEITNFRTIVVALLSGNTARAVDLATVDGYELQQYADRGDESRESYLLREIEPIQNGWGLYAFRIGSSSTVIVEAPHPLSDMGTPLIAVQVYRKIQARALLIAGAHRDANADGSADVAHEVATIFHTVHEALVTPESVVLQIHGFTTDKHPNYPQVVLGHNQGMSGQSIQRLAKALTSAGLRVGICDGDAWSDLCGETNVQSSVIGQGEFIHIELDETVRDHPKTLVDAIEYVFASAIYSLPLHLETEPK